MICADRTCNCGIVSDTLTISGSGQQGEPYRLETNAFAIVTSVTRPASPFVGQFIWETDSQRQLVWTGAHWLIVGGAMPSWNLTRLSTDAVQSIPSAETTEVALLHEVVDSDGFHTGTQATAVIPAGYGGDYLVTAGLQYSGGGTTNYRLLMVTIASNSASPNEVDTFRQTINPNVSTINQFLSIAKHVRLEAGAIVILHAHQVQTTDLDISRAYLTGTMVRHVPTLT